MSIFSWFVRMYIFFIICSYVQIFMIPFIISLFCSGCVFFCSSAPMFLYSYIHDFKCFCLRMIICLWFLPYYMSVTTPMKNPPKSHWKKFRIGKVAPHNQTGNLTEQLFQLYIFYNVSTYKTLITKKIIINKKHTNEIMSTCPRFYNLFVLA